MFKLIVAELCITQASCSPVKMSACSTHVGSELVDVIKNSIDNRVAQGGIPKISNHEVIRCRVREFRIFQINTTNPISLPL